MQMFDGIPRTTTTHQDEENNVAALQPIPSGNLARGIVWADILADIAADEEARQQRRDLPEAA